MAARVVGLAERYRLAEGRVTLDGKPATIGGVRADFAKIRTLDGKHEAEWAWSTAALIINERGGAFRL